MMEAHNAYFRVYSNADYQRHVILADHLGYKAGDSSSVFKNSRRLLISDSMFIIDLLKLLCCLVFLNRRCKIELILLELYSISFNAIWDEAVTTDSSKSFFYRYYLLIYRSFRCLLLKWCIMKNGIRIFVPSRLRINFLKTGGYKHIKFDLLRNLPSRQFIENLEEQSTIVQDIINGGPFFFLPGRINDEAELDKAIAFAVDHKIRVVISSAQKVNLRNDRFKEYVIETGIIKHEAVRQLMKECLAGIVLYLSSSINQRYSASSKLFEFLLMDKIVITSYNEGVADELKSSQYEKIVFINQLTEMTDSSFFSKADDIRVNDEFFFESEALSLVRI